MKVNVVSLIVHPIQINQHLESIEDDFSCIHSLVTLRMTDRRKFAGVASQFRKDKSRLVQYLVNMADEAFF
jgi:hypothetical protein